MIQKVTSTARIVDDQNEALRFYTEKLGFEKKTDQPLGPDARWVTVAPKQDDTMEIALTPSDWSYYGDEEKVDRRAELIGHQPSLGFAVDDCQATYETLREQGVEFVSEPEEQPYGIQAVANDLYGNKLVFVESIPEPETR